MFRFAGLLRRVIAFGVDVLLLASVLLPINRLLLAGNQFSGALAWLVTATIALFYCAYFEASALRGTPGKRLLFVQVVTTQRQTLSFSQALQRNALKLLLTLPSGIGLLCAMLHPQKRAWHDRLTHSITLRVDDFPPPRRMAPILVVILLGSVALHWAVPDSATGLRQRIDNPAAAVPSLIHGVAPVVHRYLSLSLTSEPPNVRRALYQLAATTHRLRERHVWTSRAIGPWDYESWNRSVRCLSYVGGEAFARHFDMFRLADSLEANGDALVDRLLTDTKTHKIHFPRTGGPLHAIYLHPNGVNLQFTEASYRDWLEQSCDAPPAPAVADPEQAPRE